MSRVTTFGIHPKTKEAHEVAYGWDTVPGFLPGYFFQVFDNEDPDKSLVNEGFLNGIGVVRLAELKKEWKVDYWEMIHAHVEGTGFCSFPHHMIEVSPTYHQIVEEGMAIVPTIIEYLKKTNTGMNVLMLLMVITKEQPYKPEPILVDGKEVEGFVGYDIRDARKAWIEWGKKLNE